MERQRVEPKGDLNSVLLLLHRGQTACSKISISVTNVLADGGGANPKFFKATFPFSLIISLDHCFLKLIFTDTLSIPLLRITCCTSCFIKSIAGHPTNVGVISTSIWVDVMLMFVITPRSTKERTGISGSFTASSHRNTSSFEIVISKLISKDTSKART